MASGGVNVKMGVSGVAQFKQEINKVKQSLKTVDEALKLNEKEFKATGDAQAYMQTKTELLKTKLEEQKSVLQNAEKALQEMTEKGVDKASKAFQDMQRQVLQAKGAMLDTENELNNIGVAGEDASTGVDEMNTSLKEIGKGVSYQNVTSGIKSITDGMEKALKKAIELGKAITKEVLGAGSWADDLQTRAAYYGITAEDLQRMEKTATLIDTPVDAIINAKKRLKKATSAASDDTMGVYEMLGIDPSKAKDADDLFWKTGKAIMALDDEFAQEEYAQKLLGRSWNELIPIFQAGREEYDKLNDSWSVVPQENIDKLQKMDDQYQKLNSELETVKMTFLSELAPAIEGVMTTITGLLQEFNKYLASEDGQKMMESLSKAVESLFSDLSNIDPEDVINNIKGIIESIEQGLQWIMDNKDGIVTAMKGIFAGWGALKLVGGAADMLKLINGLKGLGGGGGVSTLTGLGTGGAAGGGGGLIGAVSSFFGSGAFLPFATVAAAVLPAEFARHADEARWKEQQERWSAAGEKLTGGDREYLIAAARTMEDVYRPNGTPYDYLMGLQNRSDLQKMQLHNMVGSDTWTSLMEFWRTGGENMADFQVTQLFQDVADAYTKMAEQTEDVTGATESQVKSNDKMTAAAEKLNTTATNLPRWLGESMKHMTVQMDGEVVGRVVSDYVDEALAANLY